MVIQDLTNELAALAPELLLSVGALILLMIGVFRDEKKAMGIVTFGAVLLLTLALFLSIFVPTGRVTAFSGGIVVDTFARFMKVLVLFGSAMAIVMSSTYMRVEKAERFEYPVLIIFAAIGMCVMISASDLMTLYIGLEMQSLSLYVIASIKRDSLRATEAGLKYFVLGALSSGMLLYGSSLVYGFTGSTAFDVIFGQVAGHPSLGLTFGLVFVLAGLAFKISAVPFHMWTPDVYEGAPTPVTAFLAAAPKIAAMALLTRVLYAPFLEIQPQWQQIITFIAVGSMVLGAVAAIGQNNIKRLMAYSSIGHMGFALVGLAAGSEQGIQGVVVYMTIYLMTNLGVFAVILAMRRQGQLVEDIADLAGLSKTQPMVAASLAILMFSLAGIPPMAGFFGKFYVFMAAIDAKLFALAVIGVLASVVGAFYYLRIVKLMYFDEPAPAFDTPMASELSLTLIFSTVFTLLFFTAPAMITGLAELAARSIQP